MKAKDENELTSTAAARRNLTGRTLVALLAVTGAAGTLLVTIAFAQSVKEIRGATPYAEIAN